MASTAAPAQRGVYPQLMAPRLAAVVLLAVFASYVTMTLASVIEEGATLPRVASAVLLLAALLAMQLRYFSHPNTELRSGRAALALGVNAALALVPFGYLGTSWASVPAFLAGNALLVLPSVLAWPAWAAIVTFGGFVYADYGSAYGVLLYASTGLVIFGLSRLRSLVTELDAARAEPATRAVTEDRLRFARDLHDLLGAGLSAITLKCALAHRLVTAAPERAGAELAEVLTLSRKALADARAIARGAYELSLDDEVQSARSVLATAGVRAQFTVDCEDPPAPAVIATVVREGVTNVLRHSSAASCTVSIAQAQAVTTVEIVNDGLSTTATGTGGSGVANLTRRVTQLGGKLTTGIRPDGTYRLHATVPNGSRSTNDADPAQAHERLLNEGPGRRGVSVQFPGALLGAVIVGFFLLGVTWAVGGVPAGHAVFAVVAGAGAAGLQLGYFANPRIQARAPTALAALTLQAALVYAPIIVAGNPFLGLPGLFAGSLLLTLRLRYAIAAFVAVLASMGTAQVVYGGAAFTVEGIYTILYGVVSTGMNGLIIFGLTRLRSMVEVLRSTRRELAELAVAEQRLTLERDLHSLIGDSLSSIIGKAERTSRWLPAHPARAEAELADLELTARQALADVREASRGYRQLALDEEAALAGSMLRAAGIDLDLHIDHRALPENAQRLLTTALREAVTNVLRHSEARHCEITLSRTDETFVLDVINDGGSSDAGLTGVGDGIESLRTQISSLGGSLHARDGADDTFALHAEIPMGQPDRSPTY